MKTRLLTTVLVISAAAALAHGGVKNPDVLKRMDSMKATGEAMKVLGNMAKGMAPFDAEAARAAATEVAEQAALTPVLFDTHATDPKSEAKAVIWQDFEDFTAKAEELESVALDVSTSLDSAEDLGPALAELGSACKACHSVYRK
ncbi:c-type cytochrome [Antarctobacter sp.]|uniref:c-type cytochrome n=1 Tax=Antarctobacter sp. TaxID=1872577 RepID=UPI003A8FA906